MAKARDYLSMCPQERFSLYKFSCQAYPLLKRIGPLAAPQCYLLCLLLSYCFLYRQPLKSYLSVLAVIPCPKSPINTFGSSLGSTLLLIKNAAIDPFTLRVITCPWHALGMHMARSGRAPRPPETSPSSSS